MANTRSADKRMRQNEARRTRNAAIRSGVRTAVKAVRAAISAQTPGEARTQLAHSIRVLDKAVTKGVLHKRTAARRKSRLARQLNALLAPRA
jgi:small subunit ribosomal protein S20